MALPLLGRERHRIAGKRRFLLCSRRGVGLLCRRRSWGGQPRKCEGSECHCRRGGDGDDCCFHGCSSRFVQTLAQEILSLFLPLVLRPYNLKLTLSQALFFVALCRP